MNTNIKAIELVNRLFDVEKSYKSISGYKFKVIFNDYPIELEIVTLNDKCELGICSYNNALDNNISFLTLMSDLENGLNEIKE